MAGTYSANGIAVAAANAASMSWPSPANMSAACDLRPAAPRATAILAEAKLQAECRRRRAGAPV